jgi:xanthine dehydrogenase accessory factor
MAKIWSRIRDTIERHGSAGLISVVGAAGSVPREAGARIVLQPDGGFYGSIGGGRLEYEAIAAADAVLKAGRGKAQFRDWPLGPNLGQCCGGMVKTLTETFDARDLEAVHGLEEAERAGAFVAQSRVGDDGRIIRTFIARSTGDVPLPLVGRGQGWGSDGDAQVFHLATPLPTLPHKGGGNDFIEHFGEVTTPVLLFGAGHVGRAVVLALAPLPFAVRWIDSRPDQFPQHVPPNVATVHSDAPVQELAHAPGDALIVVMTHAHPLDFDITAAALQRESFEFVGLIGSETKRARFVTYAQRIGVTERQLDRLVCPIGVADIHGKEPAVIAAALAAQLLTVRERTSLPQESPAVQPA